ncbi:hypothetical protein K435DRAFT_847421 [Dendrothele bispora CBS 962.96]|uniref:Membrane anchor Opy2 N-terminal domain-containing protein n=1 Tax=Dendrothele bispora (strain CBS 962.96) TaxID=1314807 RepID=A0A4S8MZI3_DENBC|nr:hypothetical protein K435DRAFT_847421 [Dendrothele bispora CBS 962.96]
MVFLPETTAFNAARPPSVAATPTPKSASCDQCSHFECQPKDNSNATSVSGGGVSKGALAGAVVGTLIFLGIVIGLLFFYRRNNRLRKKEAAAREVKPDVPAAAADVLNRPDPMEKPNSIHQSNTVRVYSTSSNTTIDLDPESQAPSQHTGHRNSVRSNPFDDNHSIQTAGTEGTNVIPIALVSPETRSTISEESDASRAASPARPPRSPDMGLNLDHVNVSRDSLRSPKPNYALSQRSNVSGASSRNSYMSNASYSSDFLNEAPMIMTANKVVIGEGLKPPTARPAVTSPLAATSFGPGDMLKEADETTEDGHNPFADKHSSTRTTLATSTSGSPRSVTTFGQLSPAPIPVAHHSVYDVSRPSSIGTQAGSVIDIASATRVNVGLTRLAGQSPRPEYRTTMGRLVTPNDKGTFEEQQQRALAHAQAQAQAQGLDKSRRTSGSSAISATADSILESFPFVPPSPISNRPLRSPPVSPLAQQSFSVEPPTPTKSVRSKDAQALVQEAELPAPPNRRTLGLSTGSQLSTASSGLGSFPFQIDTGASSESSSSSAFTGRQRASLDTLALTSDLSSYPLGFDRDSEVPSLRKN